MSRPPEIPIAAAQEIAERYGYDQVVVIGRKVGSEPDPCGEHITTFGVDDQHKHAAALAGRALQRFMQWPLDPENDPVVTALGAAIDALRSYQHGNVTNDLARSVVARGRVALRRVVLLPIGQELEVP